MGKLDFGRIGRVIDHIINKFVQLILETRKEYNQTVYLYTPSGDNSVPCKEDRLIILKVDGTGKYIATAVATESQGANPGEKIFFGRNQKGEIVLEIKMLNGGEYILDNVTKTTKEATGNYTRKIKGNTKINEKQDRTFLNEANVNETIIKNKTTNIIGNYVLTIGGDLTVNVTGNIKFVGKKIDLN
jgi:hypothetical protein